MADIVSAKKELYQKLKSETDVTGAGIKGSGKSEHIVIFVRAISDKVKSLIPSTFKGNKVKVEKKRTARAI